MIDFSAFYQDIAASVLQPWLETIPSHIGNWQRENRIGALPKWEKVLQKLHYPQPDQLDFLQGVTIGSGQQLKAGPQEKLENLLQLLHPWRKGPFDVHGIHIDTEWRSDWKWERVAPHISPLQHRTVLDVGCGSGYHMWRMFGAGANMVVGIDPSALFLCQFEAIKKLAGGTFPVHLLPLGIEELPAVPVFDTVFSMGVLYHRRSPIDHLLQLREQLRDGGELVLETLVIDGDANTVLVPEDRYGKMNNVWFIPSVAALQLWLKKCEFRDIRCVNLDVTSLAEQRTTNWMRNESLVDYLDPNDVALTVEGYPAPKRAIIIANK